MNFIFHLSVWIFFSSTLFLEGIVGKRNLREDEVKEIAKKNEAVPGLVNLFVSPNVTYWMNRFAVMKTGQKSEKEDPILSLSSEESSWSLSAFLVSSFTSSFSDEQSLNPTIPSSDPSLTVFAREFEASLGLCSATNSDLHCQCVIPSSQCKGEKGAEVVECAADLPYEPVCGCDGHTYDNPCQARFENCNIHWTPGACPFHWI